MDVRKPEKLDSFVLDFTVNLRREGVAYFPDGLRISDSFQMRVVNFTEACSIAQRFRDLAETISQEFPQKLKLAPGNGEVS